jgi:glycerol-3-phosphate acyltransferase PlsY
MPESMNWSLAWPYFAAAFAMGYGFGSIPFGLVLTRIAGLGDIRQVGSGNIGAHECASDGTQRGSRSRPSGPTP